MSSKTKLQKGKEMFKSEQLKEIIKREGKKSYIAQKIMALKPSKEFDYLVDIDKV
jgi:hypothetical protein